MLSNRMISSFFSLIQVHYTRSRGPNSIAEIRGYDGHPFYLTKDLFLLFLLKGKTQSHCIYVRLVCKDITGGQEDIPIPATNLVDDPPVAPTGMLS